MLSKPGTTAVTLIFVLIIGILFILAPIFVATITVQTPERTETAYTQSLRVVSDALSLLIQPISIAAIAIVIVVIVIYRKITRDQEEYME